MPKLDDAADTLAETHERLLAAKSELESFEKNIRKHGYPVLNKASNMQKFNLEFEQLIAGDPGNWDRWQQLINDVKNADVKYFEAKLWYDITFQRERNA